MKPLLPPFLQSLLPPLLCASIFALAGWFLFFIASPSPDRSVVAAAADRLKKLKLLHEQDQVRLETYGWVDRTNGLVRIPIERAMQLEEQQLRSISPHPYQP